MNDWAQGGTFKSTEKLDIKAEKSDIEKMFQPIPAGHIIKLCGADQRADRERSDF